MIDWRAWIEWRLLVRSFLAILAGWLALTVVVVVVTPLVVLFFIVQTSATPGVLLYSNGYIVSSFVYSFGAAVLGGWATARLAPTSPFAHSFVLAGVILITGMDPRLIAIYAATKELPSWYGWALALAMTGGVLVGGWRRTRQLQPRMLPPVGPDPS